MFEHVFMHHHAMLSSVAQPHSEVRDIHCDMRNNNEVEHGSSWTLLQSVRSHLLLHFRDSSCIFQHACMSLNVRICYARSICSYISYAVVYFYPNELRVPMHFCISVVLSLPNPRTMRCENTMRAAMQLRIPVATKAPGSSQTAAPSLAKHPTGKIEMG